MAHAVPYTLFRSGTSKGPLFLRKALEAVPKSRWFEAGVDRLEHIAATLVGSGHPYGVDGLGGGRSSTNKSVIVSGSTVEGSDVDCLFVQSRINTFGVDGSHGDCGNMVASVGAFAIEKGLVMPALPSTRVRVRSLNTGTRYEIKVQTKGLPGPGGVVGGVPRVQYSGDQVIAGVDGTGSPVVVTAKGMAGTLGRGILPTGNASDLVSVSSGRKVRVSCVDFSRPMVLVACDDLGLTGSETKLELDADTGLMDLAEEVRREAAMKMGMGNVEGMTSPKIACVSPGAGGANINTRYFTDPSQRDLHYALAMTACQCLGAASLIDGTVASEIASGLPTDSLTPADGDHEVIVSHPSGSSQVKIVAENGELVAASYVRTVRKIAEGSAFYPLE